MARDIMAAIVRAYEAQRLNAEGEPWAVKIYDQPDNSVFERLPPLAFCQRLYAHQHGRYYTMLTSDLFDLLEGDILARPDAWGGADATQDELQAAIERFFEDFVEPVE